MVERECVGEWVGVRERERERERENGGNLAGEHSIGEGDDALAPRQQNACNLVHYLLWVRQILY
jgi:hypothetical protein